MKTPFRTQGEANMREMSPRAASLILLMFIFVFFTIFGGFFSRQGEANQTIPASAIFARVMAVDALGHLRLASGQTVRLALLCSPSTGATPPWQTALRSLVLQQTVILYSETTDHWNRTVVHMYQQASRQWVQGILVGQGYARVCPLPGEDAKASALLRREDNARKKAVGHWGDGRFFVEPTTGDRKDGGGLRLFQGTVRAVAHVGETWYLNFGADWRSDFTVRLSAAQARAWQKSRQADIKTLQGSTVRIRGWLGHYHGPLLDVYTPSQLERVLPPKHPEQRP